MLSYGDKTEEVGHRVVKVTSDYVDYSDWKCAGRPSTENNEQEEPCSHELQVSAVGTCVSGVKVKALIDPGIDLSLCSWEFWKRITSTMIYRLVHVTKNLALVSCQGTRLKNAERYEYRMYLSFSITGDPADRGEFWPFSLVKDLSYDIVLGQAWISKFWPEFRE